MKPEFKTKKQKTGICQLSVKGDLTAQYGHQFKEHLKTCLNQGSNFNISLKEVTSLDVTALQLLQTVRNDLKSVEQILTIEPPLDENLMILIGKGGFEKIFI